jgi:hypothetical protein
MQRYKDGVSKVEAALREAVGDQAAGLMHRRSKFLGNLSPHEVAQAPGGSRIVLAELPKLALQATKSGR